MVIHRKKTSFGLFEIISENPLIERLTFNKEGNSHQHDVVEHCYVLDGSGRIIGSDKIDVKEGDYCRVPPNTDHWMVPNQENFRVLIWYGQK